MIRKTDLNEGGPALVAEEEALRSSPSPRVSAAYVASWLRMHRRGGMADAIEREVPAPGSLVLTASQAEEAAALLGVFAFADESPDPLVRRTFRNRAEYLLAEAWPDLFAALEAELEANNAD